MEKDQVPETTNQENPKVEEATGTTKKESEEPKVEEEVISYKKSEYDKVLQSERSKAKYELLKELGISGVNEFKEKYSQYENTLKESEELKADMQKYAEENQNLKNNLELEKLNVADEFKEDLLTLVKSKISDEKDFTSAVKEVLDKNPNWVRSKDPVKLGTEKHEVQEETVSQELKRKYPWLH